MKWTLVVRLMVTTQTGKIVYVNNFMDTDIPVDGTQPYTRMSWFNQLRVSAAEHHQVSVQNIGITWYGWVVRDEKALM